MASISQRNNIYDLINKLDVVDPTQFETANQTERYVECNRMRLFDKIDKCMPKYMYKYRNEDCQNIEALREGRVYLSSPKDFNDPAECMLSVNPEIVIAYYLKTCGVNSNWIDSGELSVEGKDFLDYSNYAIETIERNQDRIKICCFSEKCDSPLMWSHYANGHKGFLIRYKTENMIINNCADCHKKSQCYRPQAPIFPVVYKNKRFDGTQYAIACGLNKQHNTILAESIPIPLNSIIQKSIDWKYENEWRIVCQNKSISYFDIKPDAIYIGYNASPTLTKTLSQIADEKKIQLYKMTIDHYSSSFSLGYKEY